MGNEVGPQPTDKSWRDLAFRWMLSQGPSTVLLTIIIIGGGYLAQVMIPAHLDTIQRGYEKLSERNDMAIERLATSHERAIDRVMTALEKREKNP